MKKSLRLTGRDEKLLKAGDPCFFSQWPMGENKKEWEEASWRKMELVQHQVAGDFSSCPYGRLGRLTDTGHSHRYSMQQQTVWGRSTLPVASVRIHPDSRGRFTDS